jgi:alkanesulfonate monooxygenase SsuD/methylene tetrahydromethanopterin reductase-like flavin-dependent oxidoreductase (luciferase family)
MLIGITDHLEGPRDRPSRELYAEVADLVQLADRLGVQYAWFAEHHAHAHFGHLPTPLMYALHLAAQTKQIHLGSAVVCLNLHNPIDVAEQVAVADVLSGRRMAVGFGSGSTPDECALFDVDDVDEPQRHERFAKALESIRTAWQTRIFPRPTPDLAPRCWVAVNSSGAARIAGQFNFNVLFSHLRTPQQYRQYTDAYRSAGGTRLIAANRPVFVGDVDAVVPALRVLWRRFRDEGKIPRDMPEPDSIDALAAHPINFMLGGPKAVAREIRELHDQAPFDVLNVEVRWTGLSHELVRQSLSALMNEVVPMLDIVAPNASSG